MLVPLLQPSSHFAFAKRTGKQSFSTRTVCLGQLSHVAAPFSASDCWSLCIASTKTNSCLLLYPLLLLLRRRFTSGANLTFRLQFGRAARGMTGAPMTSATLEMSVTRRISPRQRLRFRGRCGRGKKAGLNRPALARRSKRVAQLHWSRLGSRLEGQDSGYQFSHIYWFAGGASAKQGMQTVRPDRM